MKPSDSPSHPYEPEEFPILNAWPEFWWMSEPERTAAIEARARANGGQGYRPRPEPEQERER
jgi:hypothetical protein